MPHLQGSMTPKRMSRILLFALLSTLSVPPWQTAHLSGHGQGEDVAVAEPRFRGSEGRWQVGLKEPGGYPQRRGLLKMQSLPKLGLGVKVFLLLLLSLS